LNQKDESFLKSILARFDVLTLTRYCWNRKGVQSIEFLAVRQLFRNHDFADLLFNGHGLNSFAFGVPAR
jgi:hypothetical protein